MKELRALCCSGCGAPLATELEDVVLVCSYCKLAHRFADPPPARASSPSFETGASVLIEWGGRWWPGTVVERRGDDAWLVHYDGWSSMWDEEVGPARIVAGPRGVVAPVGGTRGTLSNGTRLAIGAALLAAALGIGRLVRPEPPDSGAVRPTSVVPTTPLQVGQAVEALWQGKWWSAEVLALDPDGRVRIHYVGYSSAWDEVVERSRIRIRP